MSEFLADSLSETISIIIVTAHDKTNDVIDNVCLKWLDSLLISSLLFNIIDIIGGFILMKVWLCFIYATLHIMMMMMVTMTSVISLTHIYHVDTQVIHTQNIVSSKGIRTTACTSAETACHWAELA